MELYLNKTERTFTMRNSDLFSGVGQVFAVVELSNAGGVEVTYVIFKRHIELGLLIGLFVI